jgi:hypothetical protein
MHCRASAESSHLGFASWCPSTSVRICGENIMADYDEPISDEEKVEKKPCATHFEG